jgi:hypothetical protein
VVSIFLSPRDCRRNRPQATGAAAEPGSHNPFVVGVLPADGATLSRHCRPLSPILGRARRFTMLVICAHQALLADRKSRRSASSAALTRPVGRAGRRGRCSCSRPVYSVVEPRVGWAPLRSPGLLWRGHLGRCYRRAGCLSAIAAWCRRVRRDPVPCPRGMPGEPASAVLDYGGAGGSGVRPPGAVGTHRDRADERYRRICRGAAVKAADSEAIVMRGYRALWRDIWIVCAIQTARLSQGCDAGSNSSASPNYMTHKLVTAGGSGFLAGQGFRG